jgi:hypothetical protein
MCVVTDREPPPPYLGDYPHGAYVSAFPPPGLHFGDEVDDTVEGRELRVMWDAGAGPLWSDDGGLPDEPEWLQRALGLSDSLVADLLTWLSDMTAAHLRSTVERRQQLHDRGHELATRLQREVGERYAVRYHG